MSEYDVHPVQRAAYEYVGAFVDELARAGVEHVCICPGSRSTPLALIVAADSRFKLWTHIDERSAAFFALGLAKRTREPVALIATSGTAVANFLPAVTEAFFARVPLLLLTADRPRELRDVGSNQTLHQAGIFGPHVKWAVDMPLPESSDTMERHARTTAGRAVATARTRPAGPVQLNFPLREPLIPLSGGGAEAASASAPVSTTDLDIARPGERPYVRVQQGVRSLAAAEVEELAEELSRSRRPLIVCGPDIPEDAWQPLIDFARHIGAPVLADPLSGLRTSGTPFPELVDAYDTFLRFEHVASAVPPSVVLRCGALPVSKPLLQYLQSYGHVPHIVIDEGDGWRDPTLTASRMLHVDVGSLCTQLVNALPDHQPVTGPWAQIWQELNGITRMHLDEQLEQLEAPIEGHIFHALAGALDGVSLFVGNSMPIRDLDTFFSAGEQRVRVLGNRGVSGIDGIVSSAFGVAAAGEEPVLLVLGDLSFYHDLNGLLAASRHGLNMTVLVVNNDGGGIFSFLPQAEHGKHFDELFGTPTGLDFEPVVRMYGGTFERTDDVAALQQKVQVTVGEPGLHVIEFVSEREQNARLHRQLMDAVGEQLTEGLGNIIRSAFGGPR